MIDGPFAETKELVAGYWMWQVKSKEEAVEWVKRCPSPMTARSEIEIRPVFEIGGLRRRAHAGARRREGASRELREQSKRSGAARAAGARLCSNRRLVTAPDAHRAIEAVWRIESPRLIAASRGSSRDVGLAEELAQDALVAALEQWPEAGVPDNPGAWLMATAKNIARSTSCAAGGCSSASTRSSAASSRRSARAAAADLDAALDDDVGDDLLRLVFTPATRCSRARRASR